MGGVAAWLWGKEIVGYAGERTLGVRVHAADALRAVEERTGQVLNSGGSSLRRVESVLRGTKGRVEHDSPSRAGRHSGRNRQPGRRDVTNGVSLQATMLRADWSHARGGNFDATSWLLPL